MDKIPHSVHILNVPNEMSDDDIRMSLRAWLGDYPHNFRYGDLELEIITVPGKPTKGVIFSGALMSFIEIDRLLSRKQFNNNDVHVQDVDFGIPREENGQLSNQGKLLHKQLKIGSGFGNTINVLNWSFVHYSLGGMETLTPVLTLPIIAGSENLRQFVNAQDGLRKWWYILSLASQRRFNVERDEGGQRTIMNDWTNLGFDSVFHLLQFITLHNRDSSVHPDAPPLINLWGKSREDVTRTVRVDRECTFAGRRGLGVNGAILDIHEISRIYSKCIPFWMIDPVLLNLTKINHLTAECVSCNAFFRLVGISKHAFPLFGDCECPDKKMEIWGYQRLTKLDIKPCVEAVTLKHKSPVYINVKEALFPVLPGIKILYDNLNDLSESMRGCCEYLYFYNENNFHRSQTDAFVVDVSEIIQFGSLDSFNFMITVVVRSSDVFSCHGFPKLRNVTVVFNPKRDFDQKVRKHISDGEIRVNSLVYGISDMDKCAYLTLKVSHSQQLFFNNEDYRTVIIPHTIRNELTGLDYAIESRRVHDQQSRLRFPTYPATYATLSFIQHLESGDPTNSRDVCSIKFKLQHRVKHWIKMLLPHCMVGFTAKVNGLLYMRDNQPVTFTRVCGRIGVVSRRNVKAIVILPVDFYYESLEIEMEFWVLHPIPLAQLWESMELVDSGEIAALTEAIRFQPWGGNPGQIQDFLNTLDVSKVLKYWEDESPAYHPGTNLFFYPDEHSTYPKAPVNDFRRYNPYLEKKVNNILSEKTDTQIDIVKKAQAHFLTIVEGFAGSLKTDTLVLELITRHATRQGKVVVASSTIDSCDIVLERLVKTIGKHELELNIVRIWDEQSEILRLKEGSNSLYDLQHMVMRDSSWKEDDNLKLIFEKWSKGGAESLSESEEHIWKSHKKKLERKKILAADAIIVDCETAMDGRIHSVLASPALERPHFSTLLVDDASRVGSAIAFSMMAFNPSHVSLYGDSTSLWNGAICKSTENANYHMSWMSLLSLNPYIQKELIMARLDTNFRMAHHIALINSLFSYEGKLDSDLLVKLRNYSLDARFQKLFSEFPEFSSHNILFYSYPDTDQELHSIDGAVVNLLEMDITVSILKKIKNTGFDMSRVAVFCMNKEQKKLIESEVCRLGDEFKGMVSTFGDTTRARKADVSILCLIRSNSKRCIGNLTNHHVLSSALARASHYLVIIADENVFNNCGVTEFHELIRLLNDPNIAAKRMFNE